jgi:hypothetical protein
MTKRQEREMDEPSLMSSGGEERVRWSPALLSVGIFRRKRRQGGLNWDRPGFHLGGGLGPVVNGWRHRVILSILKELCLGQTLGLAMVGR